MSIILQFCRLTFSVACALLITSCANTTTSRHPGDQIGDHQITPGLTDNEPAESLESNQFPPYDTPPVLLSTFEPDLPSYVRCQKDDCQVTVLCVVNAKGNVVSARVSDSTTLEAFENAAVEASYQFRFEPAHYQGKAVQCMVKIPFEF